MIDLNIGGIYTMYQQGEKTSSRPMTGSGLLVPFTEKFNKDTWVVAIGVDLHF